MGRSKHPVRLVAVALAALASLAMALPPAHVRSGADVEARLQAFVSALASYATRLRGMLERDAPDFVSRLDTSVETHGYQVLPRIAADPAPGPPARVTSSAYSWPLTERGIAAARARLDAAERALAGIDHAAVPARRARFEAAVEEHNGLADSRRRIERQVLYNRFWQAQVPDYRARFDARTALHDAAAERQALVDRLRGAGLDEGARAALASRIRALTATIDAAREAPAVPFVRVRRRGARVVALVLPVYTDIEDRRFLAEAKAAVEAVWKLSDGEDEFRVDVRFRRIPAGVLYAGEAAPAHGTPIDLAAHIRRFPADGAVLTTSAASTHAFAGRYVALGPAPIAKNVLAHEFGHLLGFTDRYFRGYRDLGEDGYEILEIDSDPDDVMSEPATGGVQRAHFDALLRGLAPPGR